MSSPSPSSAGPFFFAWVDQDQTVFDGSMLRMDEDILDFTIQHDEGQFAVMTLTIRNPRIGLLNAGRKLWGWFAYEDQTAHVWPLFFGALIGIPTDMFQEQVQIRFNARPDDFIAAKQTQAEKLKIRPYYDPVFLDELHRDDADAILEGWSKLYHIDRISHEVTVTDILEGEDGIVVFDGNQGLYESVKCELGECPLSVVQVQAAVQWTQRSTGTLPNPILVNIESYTGGSFKSDWPKPGSELGGGWKAEASYVKDVLGTDHAKSVSSSTNFQNKQKDDIDCQIESASSSATWCMIPGIVVDSHVGFQTGICDPLGFADLGDDTPMGVNIPATINGNGSKALLWCLNCTMSLRYDARREFTEQVTINVQANVQNTVVSPTVDQNTEVLKITGSNVGLPLLSVNAWSDYAGQHVDVGEIIVPNDRSKVGGTAFQVCIHAGTAGLVEPTFSDIPGTVTNDNDVQWASLGDSVPSTQQAWTDSTPIPTGEMVLFEPKVFSDASGAFEKTGESCFLIAIHGGSTNETWVKFSYLPEATSSDDTLPLPVNSAFIADPGNIAAVSFGPILLGTPSPYVTTAPGRGTIISDGTVTWLSLGTTPRFLGIPIGGSTESVIARSYFTKDRGRWSIEHLICKARARLRLRARCIKAQWDAPFDECLTLSLRKSATITDSRIPGGTATGKITSYSLHGQRGGRLTGHVEIGVAVGMNGHVSDVTGDGVYAATGYMQPGYQVMAGAVTAITDNGNGPEISYTKPVFRPFDDGLNFPLWEMPGTITMTNTKDDQETAVKDALAKGQKWFLDGGPGGWVQRQTDRKGIQTSNLTTDFSVGEFLEGINPAEYALEAAPVACEILIHPVQGGSFNGSIVIETSTLEIPQGIDLSAGSTPNECAD